MAWTDPRTWVASEYVTATLMNTHLRDNLDYLYDAMRGAWMDVTDTMTYSSATTITIAGDPVAYNRYTKGTRLKLTQTTAKYFVVVNSDAVGSDSVITITGGSDYTLANAAIASPYYSYGNPPDYPHWFNWTPTFSASGSMTFSSVSTAFAKFKVEGMSCTAILRASGTTGGTASNELRATIPVESALSASGPHLSCFVIDVVAAAGIGFINAGTPDYISCRKYDGSNFGLSTGRALAFTAIYEI